MNKKYIIWTMLLIMLVSLISANSLMNKNISAASTDKLNWEKNDTMDTSMNIIQNKTGDDDVLLKCDLQETGTYVLEYYLEDSRRSEVIIEQAFDHIDVYYKVEQWDPVDPVNITQNLLDISYLEMNYSAEVPQWEYNSSKLADVDPDGEPALLYTIERSASSKYPGVAFEINNKRVILKWDFQTNMFYYLINGYESGNIMPISYETPSGDIEDIKILKSLEDFDIKPTYLKDNAGSNIEVTPILNPDTDGDAIDDKPGIRPGLEINFQQPKELDLANWTYDSSITIFDDISAFFEISDIASSDYIDFNFNLVDANSTINNLPNESTINNGVTYQYNAGTYTILIVQDKQDLANQNTIIQWNELAGSKIYNVNVDFQVSTGFNNYEFTGYLPTNKFAYTYMEYQLKRANMEEAYLNIKPYDVGAQDEVEYTILYSKVVKPSLDPEDDLWVQHYYTSEDSNDNIFIPVPFRTTSSQDVYQVIVKFANTEIVSQVLNYKANIDTDVPPSTPVIESLDNLYVVPSATSDPLKIQFDLTWTAPSNLSTGELDKIFENIDGDEDNDRIYYEVMVNDVPNSEDNPYEVIKVFEVFKEGGQYKVKLNDAITGTAEPANIGYVEGYDEVEELFRMNNINIYSNSQWTRKIDINKDVNGVPIYPYSAGEDAQEADILLPGINYLKIRAITMTDGDFAVSYDSVPISLSLSTIEYEIPPVDGLSYLPLYGVSDSDPLGLTLYWDSVDIDNYESHMLYPIDKVTDNVIYRVFISEDKNALMDKDELIALDTLDGGYTDMDTVNSVIIDDTELNLLRDDDVIWFEKTTNKDSNTTFKVDIQGLDKNNTYYIRVVTKLGITDTTSGISEERFSVLSSILSVTTPIFPETPGDDEIYPLAPENLEAEFADENGLGASLRWDIPSSMTLEQDTYGFEILGIENRSLPSSISTRDTTIEDILISSELQEEVKEAWRLYVEGGVVVLKKYNSDTDTWDNEADSLFNVNLPSITIVDSSNSPNKVNYYYVRSVNINSGVIVSTSSWTTDTLTTAPVNTPINLKADYSDIYSNNPKTQAIIRFDAPIPDGANLTTEYIMEIYVKGEDDIDYSRTKYPITFLEDVAGGAIGYNRLYYRINGLNPGKSYNIKVRIEDRTKEEEVLPNGSSQFPKSPFSDIITTRTDFDQEDYDKENKYYEYIDYYETKAQELLHVSYFIIENTSTKNVVKYRDDYAIGELKRASNSEYKLAIQNKETNIIYLPAKFIEEVNSNKVTLKIESNEQLIGIRPFSLGSGITEEINEKLEEIKEYSSDIVDYYIKITIHIDEYNYKINSKYPTSNLLGIEIDIIGSEAIEEEIDTEMVSDLEWAIETNKSSLISEIEDELDDGINDSKLLEIVQYILEEVKEDHKYLVEDCMEYYLLSTTEDSVNKLNKKMFIALKNFEYKQDQDSESYSRNGTIWEHIYSTYYSNMYYINTNQLAEFILVPKTSRSSEIYKKYSSEEVDVINKYKLTDVFTSTELLVESKIINRNQFISSIARLLGADDNNDNSNYLREKGVIISNINSSLPINQEEALNTFVQVYALRNNVDIEKINILNYNVIEDINNINAKYRKNLIIGANLGIIELENGRIMPKRYTRIQDIITMVTRIEEGIDW